MRRNDRSLLAGQPLAYFITFRSYGTWLPGDERGWTHRHESDFGTPIRRGEAALWDFSHAALAGEPFTLDAARRPVVERAIRDVCHHRGWVLHALNVRTNHVHLVVSAA